MKGNCLKRKRKSNTIV